MWYFLIGIVIFIILILFIPIRLDLKYSTRYRKKEPKNNTLDNIISRNKIYKDENYIVIHIFYFIPILKIRLDKKKKLKKLDKLRKEILADDIITIIINFLKSIIDYEKTNKFYFNKKDTKVLSKYIKYKSINLNFGINFYEPIINSYVIALINTIINIYIAKNINQFNLKQTKYNTYISDEIYNFKIKMVIKVSVAMIFPIIIKSLIRYFTIKIKTKKVLKARS